MQRREGSGPGIVTRSPEPFAGRRSGRADDRLLRVTFVTSGDPQRMSGGSLYHRRVAELAAEHDAVVRFAAVPARPFPLSVVDGPRVLRGAVEGADVVVIDSLASNTLGPWLRRRSDHGVPFVGSIHQGLGGIDTLPVRRVVQARFDRWAWMSCSRLIVTSDSLAAELAAAGLPRDAMRVVSPGRDLSAPAAGRAPDGPPVDGDGPVLLCVGNWLARKGIVDVLEAVAALPATAGRLHLVGDEHVDRRYRRRVLARLERDDLAHRVVRHGIVAPEDMGRIYAAADVFVLASTVEPYGMVYGEAMSAGLPVVGWGAGHLPYLIDDWVEGRIVSMGDVHGLGRALAELGADDELRSRLGDAARAKAEKLPTWSETAAAFFAVCREAVAAGR